MKRLTEEQLKELAAIDSPTVANAIEAFKVRNATDGYASMELKCRFPDLGTTVGYAVTCLADSTTSTANRVNVRHELYDAIAAAPKPCVVVIQDVGTNRLRSCHAGDVLSTLFQRLGAIGLVTDGGVRDLAGIRNRAPGFQVFSAGLVVSHGIPTFVEVGGTVNICGMTVRPGDLLHGDENGVVLVPDDVAGQVAEQAQKVVQRESGLIEFFHSRGFSLEELRKRL